MTFMAKISCCCKKLGSDKFLKIASILFLILICTKLCMLFTLTFNFLYASAMTPIILFAILLNLATLALTLVMWKKRKQQRFRCIKKIAIAKLVLYSVELFFTFIGFCLAIYYFFEIENPNDFDEEEGFENDVEGHVKDEMIFVLKIIYNTCNWAYLSMSIGFLIWKIILSARIIQCAKYEISIQQENDDNSEETSEEEHKPKKKRKMKKKNKKNKKKRKYEDSQHIEFVDKEIKKKRKNKQKYIEFDEEENQR